MDVKVDTLDTVLVRVDGMNRKVVDRWMEVGKIEEWMVKSLQL